MGPGIHIDSHNYLNSRIALTSANILRIDLCYGSMHVSSVDEVSRKIPFILGLI